jgi:hypothetical protein
VVSWICPISLNPALPASPPKPSACWCCRAAARLAPIRPAPMRRCAITTFEPEWVAGISIGAINAAIIAGNERDKRIGKLKEFWEMAASPVPWSPMLTDDRARSYFYEAGAAVIATFGVPGFFVPRIPPAPLWPPGSPQSQSFYDTAPLKATLERLVDFRSSQRLQDPAERRRRERDHRQLHLFRQHAVQARSAKGSSPSTSWPPARCRRGFPRS